MKTVITTQEKLELLGLLTLARQHAKIVNLAEEAMVTVLDADSDGFGGVDWLYDEVYEDRPIDMDVILGKMNVEVKDESTDT